MCWRRGHHGDREDRLGLLGGAVDSRRKGLKTRARQAPWGDCAGRWTLGRHLQAVMGVTGKAQGGNEGGKDRANNWFHVKTRALGFPWGEKPLAQPGWGLVCMGTGPAKWDRPSGGQAAEAREEGWLRAPSQYGGLPVGGRAGLVERKFTWGPLGSDHGSYEQGPCREAHYQGPQKPSRTYMYMHMHTCTHMHMYTHAHDAQL